MRGVIALDCLVRVRGDISLYRGRIVIDADPDQQVDQAAWRKKIPVPASRLYAISSNSRQTLVALRTHVVRLQSVGIAWG
jgi:hypothetical protein